MQNIWQKLDKPIKILAPMAGYTDSAFRQLCRELGADLVMTELISADAIFHTAKHWFKDEKGEWQSTKGKDETLQMLKFAQEERPIIIQLFGKFPEKFAFAAKWISENLKPDGIDINMGCPARKVVGSDHGAALLKNPTLACEIVRAVKENTDLPVSVKTRLGWGDDDQILEFAPELVKAGISAIMIHGRTYKDGFKGRARWDNIFEVKKIVGDKCVVIGNGDLDSMSRSRISSLQYGMTDGVILDGYSIGRAAIGKPWIFSNDEITPEMLKKIALRHAKLSFERKGEHGIVEFRKHLLFYLKGFPGAKDLRKEAVSIESYDDVAKLLSNLSVNT
ncbi:MAG: tRNA-dihydrouridine synthase family protein [Patescibacteria group bacterium]|jgi:nifR3 family TIM-barrel protein